MPKRQTLARAEEAKKAGKSASTQAGEFIREQMERLHGDQPNRGPHRVKSKKQAIAIGLSEARQAGIKVPKKK
jgi:hypothetical protein